MRPPSASRIVTTFAVAFLVLDALLFGLAGRFIPASVCAVAAVVVILAWRRYRRALAELADARRELKREAESLRELLHTHLRN